MKPKTILTVLGIGLGLVGAIDLLLGNTSHDPLPNVIGDHLDQQTDVLLIGAGAAAWWFTR